MKRILQILCKQKTGLASKIPDISFAIQILHALLASTCISLHIFHEIQHAFAKRRRDSEAIDVKMSFECIKLLWNEICTNDDGALEEGN
jgi:hypothetical protein